MPYRFIPAIAVIFILSLPLVAVAQDDDAAYEEMLDLSEEAATFVADGLFERGAIQFRQAYAIYPDSVLLKNEMIAWYHAGDCRSALPAAQQFLETDDVLPEDRSDVQTVQIKCHLQLAEEAAEDDDEILANYHLDAVAPMPREAEDDERYVALREDYPPRALDVGSPDTSSGSNIFAWSQITGGVVLAGLGLSMHAVALDRQSQLRELSQSGTSEDARLLERRRDEWSGFQNTSRWAVPTLYVLGTVAIGSGIYFLTRKPSEDRDLALSPGISSDGVGFSLSGRF